MPPTFSPEPWQPLRSVTFFVLIGMTIVEFTTLRRFSDELLRQSCTAGPRSLADISLVVPPAAIVRSFGILAETATALNAAAIKQPPGSRNDGRSFCR